jgi:DNA-binding transcriptional MerR regulator
MATAKTATSTNRAAKPRSAPARARKPRAADEVAPAKAARAATGRMKIGDAAKMLGTTTRTLTYYEDEGLIDPKRTPKGTRLYSEDDVKRARIVHTLSQIGIGMQRIKEIALTRPMCSSGKESSHKIVPILESLGDEIGERIQLLAQLKRDVERGAELIRTCWYCTRKPGRLTCPPCPVEANLDDSLTARLVWDPDRGY